LLEFLDRLKDGWFARTPVRHHEWSTGFAAENHDAEPNIAPCHGDKQVVKTGTERCGSGVIIAVMSILLGTHVDECVGDKERHSKTTEKL
jgi:hypothetical protein